MVDKIKILIVSGAFFPENTPRSFRATELVKEFCRQGHQVTVGIRYNPVKHEAIRREFGFEIIDLGKAHFHHLRGKEGSWWSKVAGKLNRLAELLFEFPDVEYAYQVKNQLAGIDGFDLLISIAVPHPIHWCCVGKIQDPPNSKNLGCRLWRSVLWKQT